MGASIAQVPSFADGPPGTNLVTFMNRLAQLRNERNSWVDHWSDLSDYMLPRRGRFLAANSNTTNETNNGSKKNNKIIDSTGTVAARTLASGMMAGITSPARPWFKLRASDRDLMQSSDVREWFEEVEQRMYQVFAKSNLYNALPQLYEELGVFGTSVMFEYEDFEDVVRFEVLTVGEYYIANSERLVVDSIYREFQMTVMQIFQKFCKGDEAIAEKIMTKSTFNLLKTGSTEVWVPVVHLIEPNDTRLPHSLLAKNFKFRSVYFEGTAKGKDIKRSDPADKNKFLRVSGFHEFPAMAPRWHVTGYDVYGRSPGMDALGDIKQLQVEQKRKAQAIDKQVAPPMVAPSTLKNSKISLLPGDVTFADLTGTAAGQAAFRPAFEVRFDLSHMTADITSTQDRVKDTMYSNLFLMLAQSDLRYMTAREVNERHEEKLLALGPVLERLHDELLDPLIVRTFNIMERAGLIPPRPQALKNQGFQIEYISLLAQAQKQVATVSIETTLSFTAAAVQLDPKAAAVIDVRQAIREYADARGAPVKILRTQEDLSKMDKAMQQQEDLARSMAAADQGANLAKTMSETDTGSKNILTDITQNAQQRALGGASP